MSKRKLRVFEAFAGIGAQASALSRMNIDYEIVGISDWYIHSICVITVALIQFETSSEFEPTPFRWVHLDFIYFHTFFAANAK